MGVSLDYKRYLLLIHASCFISCSIHLLNGDCNFAALNNEYNTKGDNNFKNKQKNPEGLGFDPGATHNLGKCNRIPGHTRSGDLL